MHSRYTPLATNCGEMPAWVPERSSRSVFSGSLFRGASVDAGELGHVSIDYDGRHCPCGNRGCVEQYASTQATVAAARRDPALRARLALDGTDSAAYDAVARAAVNGDTVAYQVLDQAARRLSVSVTSMVNLLDLGRAGADRAGRRRGRFDLRPAGPGAPEPERALAAAAPHLGPNSRPSRGTRPPSARRS